jgi:hypothetical protein
MATLIRRISTVIMRAYVSLIAAASFRFVFKVKLPGTSN